MNFIAWGVSEGLCARGCETPGQLWYLWVQSEEFVVSLCFVCVVVAAMGCRAQPRQVEHTKKAFFPRYLRPFTATCH